MSAIDAIVGGISFSDSLVTGSIGETAVETLNICAPLFITAFLVTLVMTPIARKVAFAAGVVDRPDKSRKLHDHTIPYLGGVAVLIGLLVAVAASFVMWGDGEFRSVPICIVVGMLAIGITGLADDIWGWDPRLKIAGQLVAAAALAFEGVGVSVAAGVLGPLASAIGVESLVFQLGPIPINVVYWTGTAIIAIFVLGGCNAANLIDGLDGLLPGTVAIVAVGLVSIGILMLPQDTADARIAQEMAAKIEQAIAAEPDQLLAGESRGLPKDVGELVDRLVDAELLHEDDYVPRGFSLTFERRDGMVHVITESSASEAAESRVDEHNTRLSLGDESAKGSVPQLPAGWSVRRSGEMLEPRAPLTGARIVLAIVLLGAVLGFLPYNFNPATVFLGDSGSLLLGYMCVVIILMLGERGQTHLVFAGLIVFGVPIMDTTLAIIRRKLAGTSMSAADDQHIHHQLRRGLGSVKRAVFALYGIGAVFCVSGVALAALVTLTGLRVRFLYAIVIVLFSSIVIIAIKAARRQQRLAKQAG